MFEIKTAFEHDIACKQVLCPEGCIVSLEAELQIQNYNKALSSSSL